MTDLIEIGSAELSAAINPVGAELTHLRDADGRELMTDADPAFWTGHAPILFPIVGALNGDALRVEDETYELPKHGFARHSAFDVVAQESDRTSFRLIDSSETEVCYPFHFLLEVDFAIEGATLTVTARIGNSGDTAMPASFGFHPAFAWPLPYGEPRADHRITFDADEPEPIRQINAAGLVVPEMRDCPLDDARTLPLRDDLFSADALIWDEVRAQSVRYGAETGPQLEVAFPDTPKLGIWTKPGARFICIEPWHGIADPEGYAGAFRDKPGVFELAPGDEKQITMRVTLRR